MEALRFPTEEISALLWVAMRSETRSLATEILGKASIGDPEFEADANPSEYLVELLTEPGLNSENDRVHLGFLDTDPIAIVIAQVMPSTGWSRIAFMGLIPSIRGRGLGRHVHNHGFSMLRSQGGCFYEGGTSCTNTAMLTLLRANPEASDRFEVRNP